jgi:outer membrane protein assembly factor BamB
VEIRLRIDVLAPFAAALLASVLLLEWMQSPELPPLEVRRPRPGSTRPASADAPEKSISETVALETGPGQPGDWAGAWPQFRGERSDGVARNQPALARSWPERGPPVVWSIPVGLGHAGAAARQGRLYVLDYDEEKRRDALRCLAPDDAREIWRLSYAVVVRRQYGMSRTVPAVTGTFVVTLGPKCHVVCADAKTGKYLWSIDLAREYGTRVPPWRAGQCPLIHNGRAVLGVGGTDVLMMAVDCRTGEIAWKTPNPQGWGMTHSSVIPMTLGKRTMFLYCASGGIAGVDANDGRVLWQDATWRVSFANVPSPVPIGDGRILLAGGYGAGSRMLRLKDAGGRIEVETVWQLGQKVFGAEQHTPILYGDHIYAVRVDGELVCLDLDGRVVWTSGREHTFGRGPYLIADGLILVMNDTGVLTIAEASPAGYKEHASAKVLPAADNESWGPMVLVDGRLIVRDLRTMTCLDLRRK